MELENFMTATEFAEKINTPYPTVAGWLRDGRVPGAIRQKLGNMEIWMIPVDVLKDFVRPKMGRPMKIKASNTEDKTTAPGSKKRSSKKGPKKKGGAAK